MQPRRYRTGRVVAWEEVDHVLSVAMVAGHPVFVITLSGQPWCAAMEVDRGDR